MEMKNELLLTGILLALMMLLVGCIGPSNSGNQGAGKQEEIQQPSPQWDGKRLEQAASQPGSRGGMGATFVQACDEKAEGDACTITFGNQTIDGKCVNRQGNISCIPGNGVPGNGSMGQMPSMAGGLEACGGKVEGDACAMTFRNQTVDGACRNWNENLTCTPNNPGMGQRQRNPDR